MAISADDAVEIDALRQAAEIVLFECLNFGQLDFGVFADLPGRQTSLLAGLFQHRPNSHP